jgi:hypothetical protein
MRKAFDWERSRISMLEVEAVPQSCPDWFEFCFVLTLKVRFVMNYHACGPG